MSVACGWLFWRSQTRIAYSLLFALTVFKYLCLLLDYRMMGNYHYMPFLVSFFFLFIPQKSLSLRFLITLFYVAAGSLKFNLEWLSGASIGEKPDFLPQILFEYSCAYVVALETLMVWLLWSKRRWLRFAGLAQLVLFHAVSWYWVGYFYPLIMASLLSIYPLGWHSSRDAQWRNRDSARDAHPGLLESASKLRRTAQLALMIYILLQVLPHLSSADSALDGTSRILSLNMYDARSVCTGAIFLHYNDGEQTKTVAYRPDLHTGVRIHCDPILFEAEAHNLCRDQMRNETFRDLDIFLVAKRSTGDEYSDILRGHAYCAGHKLKEVSSAEISLNDEYLRAKN